MSPFPRLTPYGHWLHNTPISLPHATRSKLTQLESETQELLEGATTENQQGTEWKRVKQAVRELCMEMHEKAEHAKATPTTMRGLTKSLCCGGMGRANDHERSAGCIVAAINGGAAWKAFTVPWKLD